MRPRGHFGMRPTLALTWLRCRGNHESECVYGAARSTGCRWVRPSRGFGTQTPGGVIRSEEILGAQASRRWCGRDHSAGRDYQQIRGVHAVYTDCRCGHALVGGRGTGKWDQQIHDVCFRPIRRRDSPGSSNCKYDIILYCDHVMYVVVQLLIAGAARTRVKRKDDSWWYQQEEYPSHVVNLLPVGTVRNLACGPTCYRRAKTVVRSLPGSVISRQEVLRACATGRCGLDFGKKETPGGAISIRRQGQDPCKLLVVTIRPPVWYK